MAARHEIAHNILPKAELTREQRVDAFVHGAGLRYGLVFGLFYSLLPWVNGSLRLMLLPAHGFWVTAALGIPIALVVCMAAGRIASRGQPEWLSYVAWSLALVLLAFSAAHIPFDGATAVWAFLDPSVAGVDLFPFGVSAAYRMVLLAILGGMLGLLTAFCQSLAESSAWDRSTDDQQMTHGGWAALGLFALPALVFGFATDQLINRPLIAPQDQVAGVISYILHAPSDPRVLSKNAPQSGIPYYGIALERDSFTDHFVLYVAGYDPESLDALQTDVVFDNGFMLRCNSLNYGEIITGCRNLMKDYGEWMSELMTTGALTCGDCPVQVNAPTLRWLQERRNALPKQFTLSMFHGPGPLVYVQAHDSPDHAIQCRMRGRNPTVIDVCRDVP